MNNPCVFPARIEFLFNIYNREYFNGELPLPDFEIIHKKNTFGRFECNMGWRSISNPVIKVSDRYDYTEDQLRDIIVHEMIHYYLAYIGKDRWIHHGKAFRRMMNDLNLNCGLNIQVTYDPADFQLSQRDPLLTRIIKKVF